MESCSTVWEIKMKNLLKKIIETPINYARFLNTFSMLEYVGARKIIKSQQQEDMNEQLLDHVARQIRHALIIKCAAKKYAGELCDNYLVGGLMCGLEAYQYFQNIDHAMKTEPIGALNSFHAYLYTTVIIETRGIMVYSLIDEVLEEAGKATVFSDIIIENKQHLAGVTKIIHSLPNFDLTVARLRGMEEKEFSVFLQALGGAVGYKGEF